MGKKKVSQKAQQREKTKAKAKQAKAQAPKSKAKAAKSKARPRIQSPRSQPLPGMEQVTNRTLNRICEHVSDVRREMVLVPGDVHLRVRLLKEGSSAEPAKGSGQEAGAIAEALTDPDEDREGVDAADEEADAADLEG